MRVGAGEWPAAAAVVVGAVMASWSRAEDQQPAPGSQKPTVTTAAKRWEWIVTFNTRQLDVRHSSLPAWTRVEIVERADGTFWFDHGKVWPVPDEADEVN